MSYTVLNINQIKSIVERSWRGAAVVEWTATPQPKVRSPMRMV